MKYRLKGWVKVVGLIIVFAIACKIIQINFDKKDIESQNKTVIETITTEIDKSTQPKQMFAYESKNDVRMASNEYGIEYELLEAIIRHETGNRTSRAFKELNNPCGMMYWNGSKMTLREYETVGNGYMACASNLKRNYIDKGLTTIEQIQKKYAPVGINDKGNVNKDWLNGVTSIYNSLKEVK